MSAARVERLETGRLWLDPLAEAHRAALGAIYADARVASRLLSPADTPERFDEAFARMRAQADTLGMWAVVLRETGELIGRCGFYAFADDDRSVPELAFLLAPAHHGRGLATEAAARCTALALDERRWPALVALVRPENAGAARVLAKLGFRREGRRPAGSAGRVADLHRLRAGAGPPDAALPRYAERPLPPYRYLPGRSPHPERHAGGHARRVVPPPRGREALRHGADLFNRGYWWEAHEAWEGPWRDAGRSTPEGRLLGALIQAAAALLKWEIGGQAAARRLAARSVAGLRAAPAGLLGVEADALALGLEAFLGGVRSTPPRVVLDEADRG